MSKQFLKLANISLLGTLSIGLTVTTTAKRADAFGYIFAGETFGTDLVTHQIGYNGSGGILDISVGIDPNSLFATDMEISVQNVIRTWNELVPTTGNLQFGSENNIGFNQIDFESTLLHEMGHSLGLSHVNAASESGLSDNDKNYTKATNGANNVFDLNPGADGIRGSADDIRGDDLNLNWFRKDTNNPFDTDLPEVIDSTTYSVDLADLPGSDLFSTNADRDVSPLYSAANTEAVMQQGAFFDEAQRTLSADDVAGIRYSMAGLDELAGTSDDYFFNLQYAGFDSNADIVIDFDNNATGFAVSQSSGFLLGGHAVIAQSDIFFNSGFNWFFNDVSNAVVPALASTPVPEPSTLVGTFLMLGLGWKAKFAKK